MIVDKLNLACCASGRVTANFVRQGHSIEVIDRSNVITYSAADTIAKLAAGLSTAAPSAIGVMYGGEELPSLAHPSLTRDHSWEALAEQAAGVSGNVAIMPLSLAPSISAVAGGDYAGNTVTFSANTGAVGSSAFSGVDYAGALSTLDPVYFYQVLLLCGQPGAYTIFARSTLLSGSVYKSKPDNYELAIQWAVTFK